ncbi:hypothetical protein V6Z11_A13G119200 [Gossypium hirsutum]
MMMGSLTQLHGHIIKRPCDAAQSVALLAALPINLNLQLDTCLLKDQMFFKIGSNFHLKLTSPPSLISSINTLESISTIIFLNPLSTTILRLIFTASASAFAKPSTNFPSEFLKTTPTPASSESL